MDDLIVATAVSKPWGLHEEYLKQLEKAGIDYYVHTYTEPLANNDLGDLGGQLKVMQALLDKVGHYKKIVMTDGWDVLYFGTKAATLRAIPDTHVLLAAESPYWPHDDGGWVGTTPWRSINGGMLAGTPDSLYEWMRRVQTHFAYGPGDVNQFWLNKRLKEGADFIHLDSHTQLFYCMHKDGGQHIKPDGSPWVSEYNPYPALTFREGKPWNELCDTWPQFIHFQARCHTEPVPAAWLAQARLNYK
jgi:hypothetical protein